MKNTKAANTAPKATEPKRSSVTRQTIFVHVAPTHDQSQAGGQAIADSIAHALRDAVRSEPRAETFKLNESSFTPDAGCGTGPATATPEHIISALIPSLVKSLFHELDAMRETVAGLTARLTPVLSASKKDVCGKGVSGLSEVGLASDLSALGSGFYNERQALEDLIARLQL